MGVDRSTEDLVVFFRWFRAVEFGLSQTKHSPFFMRRFFEHKRVLQFFDNLHFRFAFALVLLLRFFHCTFFSIQNYCRIKHKNSPCYLQVSLPLADLRVMTVLIHLLLEVLVLVNSEKFVLLPALKEFIQQILEIRGFTFSYCFICLFMSID